MKTLLTFVILTVCATLVIHAQSPTPRPSPTYSLAPQAAPSIPLQPKTISVADAELLFAALGNVYRADSSQIIDTSLLLGLPPRLVFQLMPDGKHYQVTGMAAPVPTPTPTPSP